MQMFREKIKSLTLKSWFWLTLSILFASTIMLFDFSVLGLYQDKNDTRGYMDLITYFDEGTMPTQSSELLMFKIRLLKPLYGFFGSILTPIFEPYSAMLFINLLFYFGTIFLLFNLLTKYLKFSEIMAFLGVAWFTCSYPMLKYGFSLMTDISGYFFIILTVYLAIKGFTENKYSYLFAAGIAAGIGVTAKESGAFGLLFILTYSLFEIKKVTLITTIKRLFVVGVPFIFIFGLTNYIVYTLINYSYIDFLTLAENEYATTFRTWKFFIGTQVATFNILWIPFFYGLLKMFNTSEKKILLPLIVAGLPSLLWSVYIVRGLFVQYIFIIPIALFGITHFFAKNKLGLWIPKPLKTALVFLPCLISIGLFLVSRDSSIWKIFNI